MAQDSKTVRGNAPLPTAVAEEPRAVSVPPPLPARAPDVQGAVANRPAAPKPNIAARPRTQPASTETDGGAVEPADRRQAQRRPAGPSRGRIAANDDAPSIGGLIYALNQKPSNRPFTLAAAASGVWLAMGLGFVWFLVGPDLLNGRTVGEILNRGNSLGAVATLLGPIALFWFLAVLAWRTDELKLRSTAMTEVAVRLAEPDRMAEQSVASLGQAVRRQVSFMNDAVGRALGRAGELEALVHNEVTALERSYEENERKIRGLIQELAGERNALITTGDRVSGTLQTLAGQVPALIDKLNDQQIKLARIIEGAGQNLTQLETSMAMQTGNLESALGGRTQQLQAVLENYTGALGNALSGRSQQMEQMFATYMQSIDSTIGGRTETLQTVFEEYARALDTTLANRAQALDGQLVERTKTLDNAFSERLRLFDESIMRSTMSIDTAVGERANALTHAMEHHAQRISDTIGSQANTITHVMDHHARAMSDTIGKKAVELDETLMHGINAVRRSSESITKQSLKAIEGLASQSELLKNVSENMLGQINGVTNRFENQGQAIMKAANALETANYKIDSTLQNRQAELGQTLERMTSKAEDLSRFMQGYSTSLEGSLSEAETRARQITAELASGAQAQSRSTIAEIERMKQSASFEADRALNDLRSKFSNVSQEVTQQLGSLTQQFTTTSTQMRDQTAAAASAFEAEQERMRAQVQSLPATTRDSADAMRRALGDQLRALEQLSSLTNREATRRDVMPPAEPAAPLPLGSSPYPGPSREQPTGRNLASLGTSLAQEMGQRQAPQPAFMQPPQQPPQMAAAPIANSAPAGADGRTGWSLGDLLARASNEDGAGVGRGAPRPPVASGPAPMTAQQSGGLNVDAISRALDPATAAAIWTRFRAGQRGVMVRSIYTAEGRVAFDEISRRFRSDLEFQQTVNRYLVDYERILGESDQRDPTGRLTQTQLTSDTGRVYLFLAHVSGRLN